MTTDELDRENPLWAVRITFRDAEVSIACTESSEIAVTGERSDVVALVDAYIRKGLFGGKVFPTRDLRPTESDVLRIALAVANEFGGKVIGLESIRARIRSSWVRLFKATLMGDPAQSVGQRMDDFRLWRGVGVTIEASSGRVIGGWSFNLGDPDFLIVRQWNKKDKHLRWEDLTEVSFKYREGPPAWLPAS